MADLDVLTVVDAMIACGVDNDGLFMNETQAQRLASDIFGDQFTSCLDVTFKELDEHFKTYCCSGTDSRSSRYSQKHQSFRPMDTR